MDNFPSLFTTEVQKDSSSETSGEWETEILGPHSDYLVAPTHELKNFGMFQLSKLTLALHISHMNMVFLNHQLEQQTLM